MPIQKIAVQPPTKKNIDKQSQYHNIGVRQKINSTGSSPNSSVPGTPETVRYPIMPGNDQCQRLKSACSRRCASPNVLEDLTSLQAKRLQLLHKRLSEDNTSGESHDEDDDVEEEGTWYSSDMAKTSHYVSICLSASNSQRTKSSSNSHPCLNTQNRMPTKQKSLLPQGQKSSLSTSETFNARNNTTRIVPGEICGGRQTKRPLKAKPLTGNWLA